MAQIAISMHDKVHAEIYHFCEQANTAQEKLKVRTMFFGDTLPQLFMNKRIQAHKACEAAFRLKSKHDMRSEDFLILLVNGDLYDEEDREYYFVTSDDYPNLKARDLGVGIISLFYTHPTSTFMRALRSRRRALSAADKAVILSGSVLLLLLGAMSSRVPELYMHDEAKGCIMDYCQAPSDLIEATRFGVRFCEQCQSVLCNVDEGCALLRIADRLSANPYRPLRNKTVFLSYAWNDKESVLAVDQWLRNKGLMPRIDQRDFVPGRPIDEEIKRVILDCSVVVVFYSKHSKDRGFPKFEQLHARIMKKEGKIRVICFCLDETPLQEATDLAVMATGKSFEHACTELLRGILESARPPETIALDQYSLHPPWEKS